MFLCWSSGHLRCGIKQLWRHACCGYNRICFQSTTTVYCDVLWVSHRPWYGCCCALGTLPGLMYFQLGYLYWFGPCCCRGLYGSSRISVGCLLAVMVACRIHSTVLYFCVWLKPPRLSSSLLKAMPNFRLPYIAFLAIIGLPKFSLLRDRSVSVPV